MKNIKNPHNRSIPLPKNKKAQGDFGESIAIEYLRNNQYSILEKNYRFKRLGEIDIIAINEAYVCFIEVKTRTSTDYGLPSESVNYRKQQKIRKLAQSYIIKTKKHDMNYRFDVIEVLLNKTNSTLELSSVNLIKNAF